MTNGTAGNADIRISWAGKSIPLNQVEEQLAVLWKISADNMRTGNNLNVRTSVLNLVICTPDIETARRASALLRFLSNTHLARVTNLILDTESPASNVSTWVTLRCFSIISDLMRHCFEQTTALLTGSAVRAAAHIIRPILKPDLPVYLWWIGEPASNDIVFKSLLELSSRVIIDSNTFFNPEQDLKALASLMQDFPGAAISDLNWARITPWRQLVAQFFDIPEYLPYLTGVHSIEIEHAVAPLAMPTRGEQGQISPNPACAILLAGWLKGRLGLRADERAQNLRDTASGTYFWQTERTISTGMTGPLTLPGGRTRKRTTTINIRPRVQPELPPGTICRISLTSKIDNKVATFTINRENDLDHVLTSVEVSHDTHMRPQRTVSLAANRSESELLQDELEITGRDYPFEETLREVIDLLG